MKLSTYSIIAIVRDNLFVGLRTMFLLTVVFCQTLYAQATVNVSTLSELREAVQKSNQTIVMKPGRYTLTDLPDGSRNIPCSGSNNTIDLSGVYVNVPVGATRRGYITISGNNNTFKGGAFEDTYPSGLNEVTDFSAYNQDRETLARGLRGSAVLGVTGNNNRVVGTKLTTRGSFPYGYGSIYGIGSDNVYGLDKRCGIVVKGKNNTIDGCEIQARAFGHGIYIQPPADETIVTNCLVEGRMRLSAELYEETNSYDLPNRSNYKLPRSRNRPIPKDVMLPLSEDGIRVYTRGGSVTVDNCTVKKMRGGIRVYLASSATVTNSTAINCGSTNFNLPDRGKIRGSKGNFAYAPLSDFRLSRSNQDIELTILPSPHAVGSHNLADVQGNNHKIVFHRTDGPIDTNLRPIVVTGRGSTIRNETEYPIILESSSSGNAVVSFGEVTDNGTNNTVTQIEQVKGKPRKASFIHPGMLHNQAELDFVKEKVRAKEQPWLGAWEDLLKTGISKMDFKPEARETIVRGPYEKPSLGAKEIEHASGAAYSQAIQWIITEDPKHVHKAIEIFNDYAYTVKEFTHNDAKLLIGMTGTMMLNAAEIIRHTSTLWEEKDQQQFEKMIREVYYGGIMKKVWPSHSEWFPRANGNWDASMMQTMLCIAIFLEDQELFDFTVDYTMNGESKGSIKWYISGKTGQCQESGRDQHHTYMGLCFLTAACDIAWKQGVDMYSAHDNRLLLGLEYTAKYNMGHEVPFEQYYDYRGRKTNGAKISSKGRGGFYPMWEKGYHHYHDRMGMEMPYTKQVLDKIRPQKWYIKFPVGQSLMYQNLPIYPKGYVEDLGTNNKVSRIGQLRVKGD